MTDLDERIAEIVELYEEISGLIVTKWVQRSMIESQAETIRQLRKQLEQDKSE